MKHINIRLNPFKVENLILEFWLVLILKNADLVEVTQVVLLTWVGRDDLLLKFSLVRLVFKGEKEFRAFSKFGVEAEFAFEFSDYHFADDKAETDAICVDLILFVLYWPKQFEEPGLIFFLDAYSGVLYNRFYLLSMFLCLNLNVSISSSEFDGVWKYI